MVKNPFYKIVIYQQIQNQRVNLINLQLLFNLKVVIYKVKKVSIVKFHIFQMVFQVTNIKIMRK